MIIQCKDCLSKYNKQTTKSCPICRQPPTFDVEKLRRLALEVKEIREEYYKKKKEEKIQE